ncbi:hypothetical protein M5U04_19185 [Xenorhabdus sp. XENO-1]|uniref:hypothetical protein n=1 Tax=Xenorhabdus bovienii TaxID=40576 RepID=UPI0020CA6DCC|nr:hypothetical protein [Xenorhabdus bovienii]MCP9270141.1 hypothetical protein [Xenorhabdus bovienii subsp. africana]
MQLAHETIARLKSMSKQELTFELMDAGIAKANVNSEDFEKALLHTQTKHAGIIKALEDK